MANMAPTAAAAAPGHPRGRWGLLSVFFTIILYGSLGAIAWGRQSGWTADVAVPPAVNALIESAWGTMLRMAPILQVAVVAQVLMPAVRRRPKLLSYEMCLDVAYALQISFMYLSFLGVIVGSIVWFLQARTGVLFPSISDWPHYVQVGMALWLVDFLVYWRHRLSHHIKVLWPIHAVHHSSERIDVLTTTRLHLLEVMAGGVITIYARRYFGMTAEAAASGFAIYLYWNYYIHTNVRIRHPSVLKYLLVSPFAHRWHHSNEESARDKNFGVVFAWNDWIFGTAYYPDRESNGYGVDSSNGIPLEESWWQHQLYPFRVWARAWSERHGSRSLSAANKALTSD